MHGLEDIKRHNANPGAYYRSREPQHGVTREEQAHRDEQQRFHGERVEARQAERNGGQPKKPSRGDAIIAAILTDLAVAAVIDHVLFPGDRTLADRSAEQRDRNYNPTHQDRIQPGIDQPPFVKFWADLNARRERLGQSEALYKEAREAFSGGPTPVGALTFVGKDWDGLRAVPAPLTDGKKTYHGEFRHVSDEGTIWRTVHNGYGPIAYATPEAALNGARNAKSHSEAHKS